MKNILMMLGVASLAITACNHENTTANNYNKGTDNSTAENTATPGNSAVYHEQAPNLSPQMAISLKSEGASEAKAQQVYDNREHRPNNYNYSQEATVRTGGKAAATSNNALKTSNRPNDMQIIDGEVNGELRNILNPEGYKAYESKPGAYLAGGPSQDNVKREIKRNGDEITVKTGDIKVKAAPGKSKVETRAYESKIKGDERKYKSKTSNTKMKSEPGKAKYESGNTKIKVQED